MKLAIIYDNYMNCLKSGIQKKIYKFIQDHFGPLENAIVADVGGGTGINIFQLYKQIGKIFLVEPSDAMRQIALSNTIPQYIRI